VGDRRTEDALRYRTPPAPAQRLRTAPTLPTRSRALPGRALSHEGVLLPAAGAAAGVNPDGWIGRRSKAAASPKATRLASHVA